MNTLHKDKYDDLVGPFTGDSNHIYVKVEHETDPNPEAAAAENAAEEERDPLEDTPPEDPNKGVVYRSLIEEDRLLYSVMAIENDCQICPHGAFRLTEAERDAIHKAAGPTKASKFARTLLVAAAHDDEAAVKAIMKAAQTKA